MNTLPIPDGNIRALFDAVLELAPAERDAYLQAHCPDPAMRAKVLALIEADASTSDLLQHDWARDIAAGLGAAEASGPILPANGCIGPFRILGVLGEGGFSTVFEAEREVEDVRQRVAVKLMHRGLHTPDARRRFELERRALLQLKHPNIVRMIEGGVTDAGQPYIAMELVEGMPIVEHARRQRLDLAARLRLFVDVCRAVEAAHRALIVHRDIKPSNVLVSREGVVSLLDFGIAKLLDDGDDARTQLPAFTPGYAAPEQREGGHITTATDVYALGVLLDELITGERREPGETRTPSARVNDSTDPNALPATPKTTRKLLRGDLDNIVLKAVAQEPEQRYASAGALAEDIGRYLAKKPVLAHPPSRWYRTRKFILRHRGGVVTTAAFLLAIFAALGLAFWQARVARLEATRASEVQAFLESLFQPLNDGVELARTPTLLELLERGRRQVEERYRGDAQIRAQLLVMFLRIHQKLGETHEIKELAEAARTAAIAAWGERDERSLEARYRHAMQLRHVGENDQARAELEAVLEDMRAQGISGEAYASVLDGYAVVRMRQGMPPAEAVELLRESLRARQSAPDPTPASLALGYSNLSVGLQQAGEFYGALEQLERALELEQRQFGPGARMANVLVGIGFNQSILGHWQEAERTMQQARDMYANTAVAKSPNMVTLLIRLCATRAGLEQFAAAEATCDDAVSMAREVGGETSSQYATALMRRAETAFGRGDFAAMQADLERAYQVAESLQGNRDYVRDMIEGAESRLWQLRGEWDRRRDRLAATLDPSTAGGRLGNRAPGAPQIAANLALACEHAPDETVCGNDPMARADALIAAMDTPRSVQVLLAQLPMAELELLHDEPARVLERLEPALAMVEPEFPPMHSRLANAYALLAEAHRRLGNLEAAQRASARFDGILAALPPQHPIRAWRAPVPRER